MAPTAAYQATVSLFESDEAFQADYAPAAEYRSFAFVALSDDLADEVRGEAPDTSGTPVIMIGSGFGKNYYKSSDETVPVDVLEELRERDLTLVRGVDGGWSTWEGRPGRSESYIDFSEAEAVDMDAEIDARREGGD
jgi:hypothetical protein